MVCKRGGCGGRIVKKVRYFYPLGIQIAEEYETCEKCGINVNVVMEEYPAIPTCKEIVKLDSHKSEGLKKRKELARQIKRTQEELEEAVRVDTLNQYSADIKTSMKRDLSMELVNDEFFRIFNS